MRSALQIWVSVVGRESQKDGGSDTFSTSSPDGILSTHLSIPSRLSSPVSIVFAIIVPPEALPTLVGSFPALVGSLTDSLSALTGSFSCSVLSSTDSEYCSEPDRTVLIDRDTGDDKQEGIERWVYKVYNSKE